MKERLLPSFVSPRTFVPLILILKILLRSTRSSAFVFDQVVSNHRQQQSQRSVRKREPLAVSSWSRIVEWDCPSSSFQLIDTKDVENVLIHDEEPKSYNLVSPREWLEYCEARQNERLRDNESPQEFRGDSCAGAYTVLRCDFQLDQGRWRIWGEDFHFHRLQESFRSLLRQTGLGQGENEGKNEMLALESSRKVMKLLLDEAKTTIMTKMNQEKTGESKRITFMITLLWDLEYTVRKSDQIPIRVQGHAFSTMEASKIDKTDIGNPNTPLQAVIGYLSATALESHKAYQKSSSTSLPNRYQNFPRAKLSSWCRRRRLLEEIFKTKDIGDVILAKPCDDKIQTETSFSLEGAAPMTTKPSIELLEGLTSNLFVVYPGKIIRTAISDHVLGGYVRQLIIDCAANSGYKLELGSISLEDASLWEEVFVTSSIRLIIPVKRLIIPADKNGNGDGHFQLQTLWESPLHEKGGEGCHQSGPTAASDLLYTELMTQDAKA